METEYNERQLEPFQNLWKAVLKQVIIDAFSPIKNDYYVSNSINSQRNHEDKKRNRKEAFIWFSRKSPDLTLVCEFAGYNGEYLHRKLNEMKENKALIRFGNYSENLKESGE